eukprot:gene3910-23365_t
MTIAKKWRSDSGEVKRVVAEEIEDHEVCCFRERLWVLLDLSDNQPGWTPQQWLPEYFARITLVRPKRSKFRDRLGKHKLGKDIRHHLMRFYPFLMARDQYLATGAKDTYYDKEFAELREECTAQQADVREQRMLLMRYFEPQVEAYPCRRARPAAPAWR